MKMSFAPTLGKSSSGKKPKTAVARPVKSVLTVGNGKSGGSKKSGGKRIS